MRLQPIVVGEHPVNIVTVALGDFHSGGAYFINSRVGVFFHILVPSKSTDFHRRLHGHLRLRSAR